MSCEVATCEVDTGVTGCEATNCCEGTVCTCEVSTCEAAVGTCEAALCTCEVAVGTCGEAT